MLAHIRYGIGSRAVMCGDEAVRKLSRLVLRHWPHQHLRDEAKFGKNNRRIIHALTLCRRQVRERWEAAEGDTPLWDSLYGGTVTAIIEVVLADWWSDESRRVALADISQAIALEDAT